MATERKFITLDKLGIFKDEQDKVIKQGDADTLAAAKSYADGLADNYDPAGAAATAKQEAIAHADSKDAAITAAANAAAAAQTQADKGVADAGKAQAAAEAAQADVDALETYVGSIPETSDATDVIGYIDAKTEGIATDAALGELQAAVTQLGKDIDAVEADCLVEADKTELQGSIDAVSGKVDTLVGEDAGKSARVIANEELAKQLIAEGAKESLDTLQEIAAWIQAHPDDASEMNAAIASLETLIGTIPEGVTATTIVGYIAEAVAAEKTRAEAVESGLSDRIAAVEGKFDEGEGSVADMIADAKQEAIDTAAGDATTKAGQALADAKAHTDTEVGKDRARLDALEATDHEHANKALLDTYTQTEVNLADAVNKKHEHANSEELNKIATGDTTKWNNAEQNAKTYADGLKDALEAKVDANTESINAFVEASEEEVKGLFTTTA